MIISCVTTRYLPNLSHISRIAEVDQCIILDLTPTPDRNRNSFINRNTIVDQRTLNRHWITVPINRERGQVVCGIHISEGERLWRRKHIQMLSHFYPNHNDIAPGFIASLDDILRSCTGSLISLNYNILCHLLQLLAPDVPLPRFQSEFGIAHTNSHRTELALLLGAKVYRAGIVEAQILSEDPYVSEFRSAGIEISISKNLAEIGIVDELFVKTSCVHSILTSGVESTRDLVRQAVHCLRN
ncbi:WbqC family protein [Rhizobium ruizarguesonis]|uniref:WbqC family protein n=1 Tax=Rhizobium ruizarguesonis TaxID=2081791 RepID=UPI001FDF78A4|nr:WbqC family protein [Rhizobium ruizarguesonis]